MLLEVGFGRGLGLHWGLVLCCLCYCTICSVLLYGHVDAQASTSPNPPAASEDCRWMDVSHNVAQYWTVFDQSTEENSSSTNLLPALRRVADVSTCLAQLVDSSPPTSSTLSSAAAECSPTEQQPAVVTDWDLTSGSAATNLSVDSAIALAGRAESLVMNITAGVHVFAGGSADEFVQQQSRSRPNGNGDDGVCSDAVGRAQGTLPRRLSDLNRRHSAWLHCRQDSGGTIRNGSYACKSVEYITTISQCYWILAQIYADVLHVLALACGLASSCAVPSLQGNVSVLTGGRDQLGCTACSNLTGILMSASHQSTGACHYSLQNLDDCTPEECAVVLACNLRRSLSQHTLLQAIVVKRLAETALSSFRRNVQSLLQPKMDFSWDIGKEVALALCHAAFNSTSPAQDHFRLLTAPIQPAPKITGHRRICTDQCHNTFQLLVALSTVQPQMLTGTSAQSQALFLLKQTLLSRCLLPLNASQDCDIHPSHPSKQATAADDASIHQSGCIHTDFTTRLDNSSGLKLINTTIVPLIHPYCSAKIYLNISCQYPFLPVSSGGVQAGRMAWLAGQLTEAACTSLNRTGCTVPQTLLRCNYICEPALYGGSAVNGATQRWLYALFVFTLIAWMSTALALVAYVRNRHRVKAPARRTIVILNMGTIVFLLDYFLSPFKDAAIAVNGCCTADNTVAMSEPDGASACGFDGFRNIFSSVFLVSIGAGAAHAWHRLVVKLSTPGVLPPARRDEKHPLYYLAFATSLASLVSCVAMALRSVEGSPLYRWCTPTRDSAFYFLTIPYTIMVSAGLLALFVSLPRLKCLLAAQRRLSFHAQLKRSVHKNASSVAFSGLSSSSVGIRRLMKLMAAYLLTMTIHAILVLTVQTRTFITEGMQQDSEDMDGTRRHSTCLMTSRNAENCSEIQLLNVHINMAFHLYTIFMTFFFSTWAYRWVYWRRHWPFNKLRPKHREKGVVGLIGAIAVLAAPLRRSSAAGLDSDSSSPNATPSACSANNNADADIAGLEWRRRHGRLKSRDSALG